jgi:hypothetical protein
MYSFSALQLSICIFIKLLLLPFQLNYCNQSLVTCLWQIQLCMISPHLNLSTLSVINDPFCDLAWGWSLSFPFLSGHSSWATVRVSYTHPPKARGLQCLVLGPLLWPNLFLLWSPKLVHLKLCISSCTAPPNKGSGDSNFPDSRPKTWSQTRLPLFCHNPVRSSRKKFFCVVFKHIPNLTTSLHNLQNYYSDASHQPTSYSSWLEVVSRLPPTEIYSAQRLKPHL